MFDAHTASFAGIARNGSNLFVTDIFQKAGIEVNEEGSVAFAATGIKILHTGMSLKRNKTKLNLQFKLQRFN